MHGEAEVLGLRWWTGVLQVSRLPPATDTPAEGCEMVKIGENTGQMLKIGAVARLTGLSVHAIRKWEQRYGAVTPHRPNGGNRLYSDADVQRLILIRCLAEKGLSISRIASLPSDELEERYSRMAAAGTPTTPEPLRVAILGALSAMIRLDDQQNPPINVVAAADDEVKLASLLAESQADVVLIEYPAVMRDTASRIRQIMHRLRVPAALVVYRFGAREHVESLRAAEIEVLRAPAEMSSMNQILATLALARAHAADRSVRRVAPGSNDDAPAPPPRFSHESLASMALTSPGASCECQRNLVDIVLSLCALEDYLAGCESPTPEDVELHKVLWSKVGAARSTIEDAIEHFAAVEGINLELASK